MPENCNDSLKQQTSCIYNSTISIQYTEASSTDNSSCRFEADVPFCQVVLNKRNSFQNPLVADANKYVKSQTHENKNDLTSQFSTLLSLEVISQTESQAPDGFFKIGKQVLPLYVLYLISTKRRIRVFSC